ncbi:MAG: hypothetical protein WAM69_16940 [Candidatus Sulfotelmatobacter sp.]
MAREVKKPPDPLWIHLYDPNQSWVSRLTNLWWPDVYDLPNAEKAIRNGFWAAVYVASVTAIVALLALFLHKPILGIDGAGLVDAEIEGTR